MKSRCFIFTILVLQSAWLLAEVGINNPNPTATLDVIGAVKVQQKLYLENPGSYTSGPDSKLLMLDNTTGSMIKFDVAESDFGPLNYVQFKLNNVSDFGLDGGFDTKISAAKYTVAVHGYFFDRSADTNLFLRSNGSGNYVEGQQFYAYVSGDTWWLRASVNNSRFYRRVNNVTNTTPVDFTMDLIVYRNDFITKIWSTPQTVNMAAGSTATAPLPAGF